MASPVWSPANEVEARMYAALEADDLDGYIQDLVSAPLFLPAYQADSGGTGGQRLLTRDRPDGRYVVVFTSVEALRDGVGTRADGWVATTFAELADRWREPGWGVAVSPTTPIGGYLTGEQVDAISAELDGLGPPHPGQAVDRLLAGALREQDPAQFLDVLVMAPIHLPLRAPAEPKSVGMVGFPWWIEPVDGTPTLLVFTSEALLRQVLGPEVPAVAVDFMAVVQAWSDGGVQLVLNRDTPLEVTFSPAQVGELYDWAIYLVTRQGAAHRYAGSGDPPAPTESAPAPVLEHRLAEADVDRYLHGGAGRVDGVVRGLGPVPDPGPAGYAIRWPDPTSLPGAIEFTVTGLALPTGARLVRIDAGQEHLLARYDADLGRWLPAPGQALRGR
jgi:hypothetical protein